METVSNNIFEARDVTYLYNDITALNNLSLSIKQNQRVAILGANGSGKSTFLRLLDALYFPDKGTITAFGENLTEEAFQDDEFALRFRRRVAFVFQNPDVQLFNPTVFDEVAFAPLQLRWSKDEIRRRVNEILETMDIAHLKDRSPHRLSGGEKKRVALASVLILDPEILLLDEPTEGIQPSIIKDIGRAITHLRAKGGMSIVLVEQYFEFARDLADRFVVMERGEVVEAGDRAALQGEAVRNRLAI